MMEPVEIQTLFSYNYWAFDRVWECIARLTDEQFTQEVQLMSATTRWIQRLQKGPVTDRMAFEEFPTLAFTRAKWDELQESTMAYLSTLTREQLDETIHWELKDRGYVADNRAWEV